MFVNVTRSFFVEKIVFSMIALNIVFAYLVLKGATKLQTNSISTVVASVKHFSELFRKRLFVAFFPCFLQIYRSME